jgi:hypothetical protein
MRGYLVIGLVMAASACTASSGGKDDTDVAGDTDTIGGDTDTSGTDTDVAGDTDLPSDTDALADCAADADLGALTLNNGDLIVGDSWYTFYQSLNDDLLPDFFQIEVYGNTTQFPGLPETGTFEISGENAQYTSCGVCVLLLADVDGDGIAGQTYLATSGSVTLTQTGPALVGTYSDLVFERVEIDPDTYVSATVGECASFSSGGTFTSAAPR